MFRIHRENKDNLMNYVWYFLEFALKGRDNTTANLKSVGFATLKTISLLTYIRGLIGRIGILDFPNRSAHNLRQESI